MQRPRHHWAFRSNPKVYRLEGALKKLKVDWWTTKKSDARAGDRVLFWNVKEPGVGVIAFGEVLTNPEVRGADEGQPHWGVLTEDEPRALIRYVLPSGLPLLRGGPHDAILRQLSVYRATQGTVYRITPEQWNVVVAAAGGWPG